MSAGDLLLSHSYTYQEPFEELLLLCGVAATLVLIITVRIVMTVIAMLRHRASRRTCEHCGRAFASLFRGSGLCSLCRIKKKDEAYAAKFSAKWAKMSPARHFFNMTAAFLLFAAFFAFLFAALLRLIGLHGPWVLPLGVVCALIVLPAVLFSEKETREAWRPAFHLLPRAFEARDLAAARRAAGCGGRTFQLGEFSVWTDTEGDFEAKLRAGWEGARATFARLAGRTEVATRPLRVLCFRTEESFRAYTRPVSPDMGRWAGYYLAWPCRRVVVCRELSELLPSSLERTLAHEIAHHLLHAKLGASPPLWLWEGVASLVASRAGRGLAAPGALLRRLRADLARERLFDGKRLLSLTSARLAQWTRDWNDPGQIALAAAAYAESAAIVEFLSGTRAEGFRRFVAGVTRARDQVKFFRECFGLTPDEAVAEWLEELKAASLPAFTAPPEGFRARVERELAAPALDRDAAEDARRLAIRYMAAAGWPWRADALIRILDDPDEPMRAEALLALEHVSGEIRGGEAPAWRAWLASLAEGATPSPSP